MMEQEAVAMSYDLETIMKAFDGHQSRYAKLKSENAELRKLLERAVLELKYSNDQCDNCEATGVVQGVQCIPCDLRNQAIIPACAVLSKHEGESSD